MVRRDWETFARYLATGLCRAIRAKRVLYLFDWHGPNVTVFYGRTWKLSTALPMVQNFCWLPELFRVRRMTVLHFWCGGSLRGIRGRRMQYNRTDHSISLCQACNNYGDMTLHWTVPYVLNQG